ncbi:hypothetical protein NMG60_11026081 [Bertholletia excelsa]
MMAKTGRMCACAFLLVLILYSEVLWVEGRHLNHKPCKKRSVKAEKTTFEPLRATKGGQISNDGKSKEYTGQKVQNLDDFRPTMPGHSPGIGHSLNN